MKFEKAAFRNNLSFCWVGMSSGSYCYLKRSMIKSTCTLSLSLSLSINFSRTLTRIFILISVTPPSSSVWALLAFHQTNTISLTITQTHTSQCVYTHKVYLLLSFFLSYTHKQRLHHKLSFSLAKTLLRATALFSF